MLRLIIFSTCILKVYSSQMDYFTKADSNRDGFLTVKEISKIVSDMDADTAKKEAENILKNYDADGDGHLDEEEYYSYMASTERNARSDFNKKIFQVADVDKNKKLSATELSNIVHPPHGSELDRTILHKAYDEVDTNHDGKLTMEEYYDGETNIHDEDQQHFSNQLDSNRDGVLDFDEYVKLHSSESDHHMESWINDIIKNADSNSDKKLSKKEFEDNYDSLKILFEQAEEDDFDEEL